MTTTVWPSGCSGQRIASTCAAMASPWSPLVQATLEPWLRRFTRADHEAAAAVLPDPAGATIRFTGVDGTPSRKSSRRARGTKRSGGRGVTDAGSACGRGWSTFDLPCPEAISRPPDAVRASALPAISPSLDGCSDAIQPGPCLFRGDLRPGSRQNSVSEDRAHGGLLARV